MPATLLSDRYRRWFAYERDSHTRVLASLGSVPEPLRARAEFQKAVNLMAHVVMARWLWLSRFGVIPQWPRELFPQDSRLEDLPERLREMEAVWEPYLARLDDTEVARLFEYRSTEGVAYRNRVEDVLTQLHGHSLYHRGQVAVLLRMLGCEPAPTDFVFWAREAVEASRGTA
jgi:uncharacterized damage-inducible protein DinB